MASIPAPVSLPSPVTWWQHPKTRARLIAAAVLAVAYLLGLGYGSWTRVCAGEHCPSISRLIGTGDNVQMQTSKVFAADGRLISELGLERRTVLPLNEIPLPVRQAFVATEDKRFYSHHGIDYWRILGAIKNDVLSMGFAQGFSTITMQLARNIFPEEISREKTLTRKLKEARVAVEIERNFPKDTILQLYLNQINLGAGARRAGAAVAARRDRGRGVLERQVPGTDHLPRVHRVVQGVRGRPRAVHTLPPGRARRPRGEHRLHPRHDRRARLRRLEVQPRHTGGAATRFDLQAVRVFRGRARRAPGHRDAG